MSYPLPGIFVVGAKFDFLYQPQRLQNIGHIIKPTRLWFKSLLFVGWFEMFVYLVWGKNFIFGFQKHLNKNHTQNTKWLLFFRFDWNQILVFWINEVTVILRLSLIKTNFNILYKFLYPTYRLNFILVFLKSLDHLETFHYIYDIINSSSFNA